MAAREEHLAWRARAIARLQSNGGRTKEARASLWTAVDKLSADLVGIGARIAETHGTPDLGNKADAVDELVYIILARRTREGAYQAAYRALESGYASWEQLAAAPSDEIVEVLRFSGLGEPEGAESEARARHAGGPLRAVHPRANTVLDRRRDDGVSVLAARDRSEERRLRDGLLPRPPRLRGRRTRRASAGANAGVPDRRDRPWRNGSQGEAAAPVGRGPASAQVHPPREPARPWPHDLPFAEATLRIVRHCRLVRIPTGRLVAFDL